MYIQTNTHARAEILKCQANSFTLCLMISTFSLNLLVSQTVSTSECILCMYVCMVKLAIVIVNSDSIEWSVFRLYFHRILLFVVRASTSLSFNIIIFRHSIGRLSLLLLLLSLLVYRLYRVNWIYVPLFGGALIVFDDFFFHSFRTHLFSMPPNQHQTETKHSCYGNKIIL